MWLRYVWSAARLAFAAWREGRLPLSPRRWLIDLRHLYGVVRASSHSGRVDARQPPSHIALPSGAQRIELAELEHFLASSERLALPVSPEPVVSIVLLLFNRVELTLQCLRSIAAHADATPVEVIVVDNNSTDATSRLLDRVDGARIERQSGNLGFVRGCNLGARLARGELVLFLNNDALLLPGTLAAALRQARESDVGAVGGRLVFPDGRLQEAGGILWRDGSCAGYGRGDSPWAPEYAFRRDVDYCSAAFLLTRRSLFLESGMFDERFVPAYYEDVDYCVRLWKGGKRVVYEPDAVVTHVEFASSPSSSNATRMQLERRALFVEKHRDWLAGKHSTDEGALEARSPRGRRRRLLFVEDRVPRSDLGSGYPRSLAMIRTAAGLGYEVTLYPLTTPDEPWDSAYAEVPRETEVMLGYGPGRLEAFLDQRRRFYDVVMVSRPHNMRLVREAWQKLPRPLPRLVYDAEALFALREIASERMRGARVQAEAVERRVSAEVALAADCDVVLTVSAREREQFVARGFEHVVTLGTTLSVEPGQRPFSERCGLLFVGAVLADDTPNADAVTWFLRDILPHVRRRIGTSAEVIVAGRVDSPAVRAEAERAAVTLAGPVDDLAPLYDRARVFVAPTRFSAGIPLKILDAASHGLPVVCTPLLAEQLSWTHEVELLSAESADAFAEACARLHEEEAAWTAVREQALDRVRRDCDPEAFRRTLASALAAD